MNKKTRILILILAIFIIIFPVNIVNADNDIEKIDIKVEINSDGSAKFTDYRVFQADRGTEHYISFGNLGNIKLEDYKVFDENGNELQNVKNWNINGSLEEKAGKYGINYTSDGFELCFGIGKLGRREFTIEYTLSSFVFNTTDGNQAIYWKFLNEDMNTIHNAKVSIVNNFDYKFEYPNTRIWGFGYIGKTNISQNELTAYTSEIFNKNNYMVLLSIFEGQIVNSSNDQSWSTIDLIEQALEGTGFENEINSGNSGFSDVNGAISMFGNDTNDLSKESLMEKIFLILFSISGLILAIMIVFLKVIEIIYRKPSISLRKREKKVNYYRSTPKYNFSDLYLLLDRDVSHIISGYLIKWISEDKLQSRLEEKSGFLGINKKELNLLINKEKLNEPVTDAAEYVLWEIVKLASDSNLNFNHKVFNNYIEKNINDFNDWEEGVNDISHKFLIDNKLFEIKEVKKLFYKSLDTITTTKGEEVINEVAGFRKYLKDFSLLNEKDISFATLWGEYMSWAAYLGIAKEVYEQFKIVYPNIEEMSPIDTNIVIMANRLANSAMSTQYFTNNPSSSSRGGGGSSFSSGGGGSFGGGSGGGTR